MRILIVEDDAVVTAELTAILEELEPYNFIVAVLRTAEEVKERLESYTGNLDIIYTAVRLEEKNIFDILHGLVVPAPMVFIAENVSGIHSALKYTTLDYITKPLTKHKVQKGLSKYWAMKNHFLQTF